MKRIIQLVVTLTLGAACGVVTHAATLSIRGELTPESFHWLHDDTPATVPTATAAYEFTVAQDGFYELLARYDALASTGLHLDGWLFLYEGGGPWFDGLSFGQNNDYVAGDVPRLSELDADCDGTNCSGFSTMLTSGVTYTLVVTSAFAVPTVSGQPFGPFELMISGPGVLPTIPLPPALLLYGSGLLGLAVMRRGSTR